MGKEQATRLRIQPNTDLAKPATREKRKKKKEKKSAQTRPHIRVAQCEIHHKLTHNEPIVNPATCRTKPHEPWGVFSVTIIYKGNETFYNYVQFSKPGFRGWNYRQCGEKVKVTTNFVRNETNSDESCLEAFLWRDGVLSQACQTGLVGGAGAGTGSHSLWSKDW